MNIGFITDTNILKKGKDELNRDSKFLNNANWQKGLFFLIFYGHYIICRKKIVINWNIFGKQNITSIMKQLFFKSLQTSK